MYGFLASELEDLDRAGKYSFANLREPVPVPPPVPPPPPVPVPVPVPVPGVPVLSAGL